MVPPPTHTSNRLVPWAGAVAVLAVAVWAYYPTLRGLVRVWETDPNYSQGYLIPVLALGLLGYRFRARTGGVAPAPSLVWGAGLLCAAVALRGAGAYFFVTPLDHASLLVTLVGLCVLFGGLPWLGVAWPALVLLGFAFPVPDALGRQALTGWLQEFATRASTFALETLGQTAAHEGNVILLRSTELGVVEACSGLKMLMVFCALTTLTAFLVPAGWTRRLILVASAPPLAVACNVVRITAAGVASESLSSETGYFIFHDLAGWLMAPLAFLLLGAEVFLIAKLFRPVGADAPGAVPLEPARAPVPAAYPE